jgi:hypothetical protein
MDDKQVACVDMASGEREAFLYRRHGHDAHHNIAGDINRENRGTSSTPSSTGN